MIGWYVVLNLIITYGCWLGWSWSNASLFTYLGEENGHRYFMYETLTIPARLAALLVGIASITFVIVSWMFFFVVIL